MKFRLYPALVFLGLASAAFASKEKPVIGLSLDTLKEERWQHDRDTFIAAAEKLGATVIVQSANSDDTRQVRDVESLISRGVDVLVIVPHNGGAMARAVKSANQAKIPVIAYDRLIKNCAIDYYLSFDNVKVGEAQGSYAAAHLPKDRPARIVRIYGAPTDNNAKMFKQGQDNILEPLIKAGRIAVLHEDWALDWKPENGKKIMNAAITKSGRQIDMVVVSERRHRGRRGPGAARGRAGRQSTRHRPGRRPRGLPAHHARHAIDDGLQVPEEPGDARRRSGGAGR
jgi:D-xylose transport system substrate-binding protein